MRKARATATALALAGVAALALPGGAAAGTRTVKIPASETQTATLRGSHGYRFQLTVERSGLVLLSGTRRHRAQVEVVGYEIKGQQPAEGGGIDLKIGDEGRLEGEFVATSTKQEPVTKGCTGGTATTEKGYFAGSFVLHGKDGYTTVDSHRISGSVRRAPAETCRVTTHPKRKTGAPSPAVEEPESSELSLIAGTRDAATKFEVSRSIESFEGESRSESLLIAYKLERRGRLSIAAGVVDFLVPAKSFVLPDAADPRAEALVSPPAPFSGSATYRAEGTAKPSWTGNLSVEFPALGRAALTGKAIAAGTCEGASHCTKSLPRALRPTIIGSDSSGYISGEVTTNPAGGSR